MLSNPNFFSVLCLVWGGFALVYASVNFVLGAKASEWFLKTFAPNKRPVWLTAMSVLYLFLVVYAWYAVATMNINNSWLVATLLTFGTIKTYLILFNYESYCGMCHKFLDKPSTLALLNILVVIFSAFLVFLGIFYYQ